MLGYFLWSAAFRLPHHFDQHFNISPDRDLYLFWTGDSDSYHIVLHWNIIKGHILYVLVICSIHHEITDLDRINLIVEIQVRTLFHLACLQNNIKLNVFKTRHLIFYDTWVFDGGEVTFIRDKINWVSEFKWVHNIWNHDLYSVLIILPENLARDLNYLGGALLVEEGLKRKVITEPIDCKLV